MVWQFTILRAAFLCTGCIDNVLPGLSSSGTRTYLGEGSRRVENKVSGMVPE